MVIDLKFITIRSVFAYKYSCDSSTYSHENRIDLKRHKLVHEE